MGVMKDAAQQKVDRRNGDKASLDWGALNRTRATSSVDWGDADPNLVTTLVHAATRRGMAISFSATSNGSGVSITILDGGERPKFYANTPDQLHELLERLCDMVKLT